jgi:hypothetical protein
MQVIKLKQSKFQINLPIYFSLFLFNTFLGYTQVSNFFISFSTSLRTEPSAYSIFTLVFKKWFSGAIWFFLTSYNIFKGIFVFTVVRTKESVTKTNRCLR